MATHESAIKAHRQSLKHRERNRTHRTRLRTALRKLRGTVAAGDSKSARAALGSTLSLIDKMAGKGVIHSNAAARYKSRLTRSVAALGRARG